MESKQTKTNHSVKKCFQIIETMSLESEPMRLQDIAERTSLPASTALRMINTLQTLGYINQNSTTLRYSLSLKFTQIGNKIASQISIRDIAHPFLVELSKQCSESVCLAIERDMEVVYIDVVGGPDSMLRFTQYIGMHAPMHCTGIGKMLLLNYSDEQIKQLINYRGLPRLTPQTICDSKELMIELNKIRSVGYALDNEECELGARCIASGVYDHTGKVVCGISVSGPISRLTMERIQEIEPIVVNVANAITKQLNN